MMSINKHAKLSLMTLPHSTKVIGTHSGTFQADEALGVWLLRQIPTYYQSPVIRSRDTHVLTTQCDIVIDVGGIYDHTKLLYDHHQRDYDERFDSGGGGQSKKKKPRCTKLSASGLVYRHYGREVITTHYPSLLPGSPELEWTYNKMYDTFMEAIDAIDTGVEPIPPNMPGVELLYHDTTGLSSRVSRLNPRWNEIDDETGKSPNPDVRFELASTMCGLDFLAVLTKIVKSDLPARTIVANAVNSRYECDSSGEIICLPSGGLPWKTEVYDLEVELDIAPLIKYVLYQDESQMWRIQCVSVKGKAFENRLGLPSEWRGVRDEDLSKIAGIDGCTFCHAGGFIGGNKSYEGVLEMARVALKKSARVE
jgi:uncharacterized UPF0160 family protein